MKRHLLAKFAMPGVGLAMSAFAALSCGGGGGAEATTFTPVLADSTRESDPAPSPDGKWIAFSSDRGGRGATQIYIMPAEGGPPRQLTSEPDSAKAGTPSWAPDGRSLLYISTRGKRFNVYSIPFEGGEARQLTHAPGSHRFATYSPDGGKIAFYSNRAAPGELYGFNIYVMDPSGEEETEMARQVTNSKGSPGHPTWSADGKWIAFVAKDFDSTGQQSMERNILFVKYNLYKVPASGGKQVRLSRGTINGQALEDTWPSWSPDGKWIAVGRQIGTKRDVWIVEVASGKSFPLTTAGNCIKPTWSYDSKSLYYSSIDDKNKNNEDLWVARDLVLKVPPTPRRPAKKARAGASAKKSTTQAAIR